MKHYKSTERNYRNDRAVRKSQELASMHGIKTTANKVDGNSILFGPSSPSLNLILVSNAESVQNTLSQVVKDFGKIDIFVANAG